MLWVFRTLNGTPNEYNTLTTNMKQPARLVSAISIRNSTLHGLGVSHTAMHIHVIAGFSAVGISPRALYTQKNIRSAELN